jgi:geranylgeranyl diphosphate synthase type II
MFENIKDKLSQNAVIVENALEEYYNYTDKDFSSLIEAQKYGLLGGGKRIRAFLVLEICRLFGGEVNKAIPYACAVEMIHASSLIHDDMPCMDNDDMRRGKPATHKAFGETLALISGDAMLVKAFEVAITNPNFDALINANAVRILAESTGDQGMLACQAIDTVGEVKKLDFDTLLRLHKLKTCRLISASVKLGCLAAGVDVEDEKYMAALKYAKNIGLAFQIIDDILDYQEGKIELNSFLSFMSLDEAKAYANELTKSGIEDILRYDDSTLVELANYLTAREY